MSGMNPAILNLVLSLGLMQVGRKLPLETPQATIYLRIAYAVSQLIQFGILYYISMRVKAKNDLATLKYVEPKTPGSQDPPSLVTTTVKDYDLAKISEQLRGMMIGLAMIGFMHGYMKYTQPLFIQSILPLKSFFDSNEVKLHLFNKPATGDLARPFKTANMFGGSVQTDKAAIAEAERSAGAAKKDL